MINPIKVFSIYTVKFHTNTNFFHLTTFQAEFSPLFEVHAGQTLTKVKKLGWVLFGDFTLKFLGEITSTCSWVYSFAAQVLGRCIERYTIVLKVLFMHVLIYPSCLPRTLRPVNMYSVGELC